MGTHTQGEYQVQPGRNDEPRIVANGYILVAAASKMYAFLVWCAHLDEDCSYQQCCKYVETKAQDLLKEIEGDDEQRD